MFLRGIYTNTFFRYTSILASSSSSSPFSTLQLLLNSPTNTNPSIIDETHVLHQLHDLFPASNSPNTPLETTPTPAPDDFLPPEDKLRGVFLQKFRGTASIHHALSTVAVEINSDILAKVVNKGNLSGESMLVFFYWALERHPNIGKDVSAYNVVIKALGRRKFFAQMMELFGEMWEKRGITPNSETLSIVMDSYIRARRISKAVEVFGELDKYGLRRDEETLTVVLKCLCRRSRVGAACSLFSKMRGSVQFDVVMYNVIIGGWSKLGRVIEVDKYLKAMVDDGLEPTCVTYSHVIEGLGRAGRVGDAVKVFEYLEEEKGSALSTVVYNAMIFNCISTGDADGALKYYEGMLSRSLEPNTDTYVRLILYFLKTRRVADSIEMFDEMISRGLIPSTGTVTEFIEPLCRYGPPHAALMIYKKARKVGCQISLTAYKLLLMRLSRFGKCGMLLNIWDEMQESGYSSDMQVYEYIINGLCNTGRLETAVQVMEESIRKGFFPGKIICSKLHNKLMDSNKVEMSYRLFLKLRNARDNENAQRYWRAKGWHF